MPFQIKRVREPATDSDGVRYLVDGLWPRGLSKERVPTEAWLRGVAPSVELRRWYRHEPDRWDEFRRRYWAELEQNPAAWQELVGHGRDDLITLLCDARDVAHSNAAALKQFLDEKVG